MEVERARFLARRRADPASELREVVGRVENVDGLAPATSIHEVVPVGDEVVDGAAGVAVGNATVDAPGALFSDLGLRQWDGELAEVLPTILDGADAQLLALDVLESGR